MNVPNPNFDPDRLPSIAARGTRPLSRESQEMLPRLDDAANESGVDYRKLFFTYLGLALKYRWLILAVCSLALAIGFVWTFTSTPIYRATTVIQINREAPRVAKIDAGTDNRDFGDNVRFFQTQYDLLKSRSLAERVAADLDLGGMTDFLNPPSTSSWAKLKDMIFPSSNNSTGNRGNLEQRKAAAAAVVQGGLSVTPVLHSNLVNISYDSPSPTWAKRVADGVADSFIAVNLERRYGATAYARNFLKERLDELKLKLEESEKAMVAYADQKEIITNDGKQSLTDSDLAALNSALQKATTERIAAQQLWDQANANDGLGLPQILADKSIQALRERRAVLMADYQEKLATFKPAYPDMLRLKAQIDQIDKEIKSAANVITHSLKAHYEGAVQQEALLKEKIDQTKRGVFDVRNKEIQYNILKREADTNRTLYEGLLQQYKDVGVAGAVATNNVAVIDRAMIPGAPFQPVLRKNLTVSLMLGLIGAAFAIILLEIVDDTFKNPEELEEQLGLAVLGIIPIAEGNILADIMGSPNSHLAEAYRSFRTALQFSTDRGAPRTTLITSARQGEGKSTTALALAVNLAQLGMKVLLIDADLRNPSQHKYLKRNNNVGLANYLAGAPTSAGIFQESGVKGVHLMASGPLPPNPAELLAGPRMMSLLSAASQTFDSIIIDSPPILGLADTPLLSSISAGTLLVVAAGETRRGVVKTALKRLHFARAQMVGAVINKFDFRSTNYSYSYGSSYGALEYYGYGQEASAQVQHSPRE